MYKILTEQEVKERNERWCNENRDYYLTHKPRKNVVNICTARKNWNGCSYADVFAGSGLECWKQDGEHNCVRCLEKSRKLV